MLERFEIEGAEDQPTIIFDKEKSIFKISGRSMPEDSLIFYTPIIEWLDNYIKSPNATTIFEFNLEYFNSSTARRLIEIFIILKKLFTNGHEIKIIWQYKKGDDFIKNKGFELLNLFDTTFEIVEIN